MDLGPYAVFIVTAYAAAIVIIAGLVVWVVVDRRRLVRQIEELETQRMSRHSERNLEEQP